MATALAILLVAHGLIHLLGAAKAFGWAELPQLTQAISPVVGALWLVSALLFLAAAVTLVTWPRTWWAIGAAGVVLSMVVIVPSWSDAKVGAAANAVVLIGVAFGFLSQGPFSLRGEYDRDVRDHVPVSGPAAVVTDADLAPLPIPVQRYLRLAGVVGQARVRSFRVRMHGRIRESRQGRWMPFVSEQYNVVESAARLFYLNASMSGIPVQGYHRYVGSAASMRVKVAALVPVVSAAGTEMTQGETVTLFNDMCLMAPAALIDAAIAWEAVDGRTVGARFTNAGHTIRAVLTFNEGGELGDFVSDDRLKMSADGTTLKQVRWSTPVRGYRRQNVGYLPAGGEGRWHDTEGEYSYVDLTIDDVQYNGKPR